MALRLQVVKVVGRGIDGLALCVVDARTQVVSDGSKISRSAVEMARRQEEAAVEVWREGLR